MGALRHYGIYLVPAGDRAQAWNAAGAACIFGFVLLEAWRTRDRFVQLVGAWICAEEAQVASCSLLFILRPWTVQPGEDQCSALLGFDLALIGALAMGILACLVPTRVGR